MGLADSLLAGSALEGKVVELFAPRAAKQAAPTLADAPEDEGSSGDEGSGDGDGAEPSTSAGGKGPAVRTKKDDPEKLNRTVFVGNVSTNTTVKALKRTFATCGKIESIRIRSVAFANKKMSRKGAVISKAFDAERKDTYNAYIVFVSVDGVQAALGRNGSELDGKTLRVDKVR